MDNNNIGEINSKLSANFIETPYNFSFLYKYYLYILLNDQTNQIAGMTWYDPVTYIRQYCYASAVEPLSLQYLYAL